MDREQEKAAACGDVLGRGLQALLEHRGDLARIYAELVAAARQITDCEHVVFSLYEHFDKTFCAVAWESTLSPGSVSLEQKFMGDNYLDNETVLLADVSLYNYRLKSNAARHGLKSMLGIPLRGRQGLAAVLECFSETANVFNQDQLRQLLPLAQLAGLLLEQTERAEECRFAAIENAFLYEVHAAEQSSAGTLLYKLGNALRELLAADGIAVFGLEPESQFDVLQEVLAAGFNAQEVTRLKKSIQASLLEQLRQRFDFPADGGLIKHTIASQSTLPAQVLTLAPVAWRQNLYGLVVYARTKMETGDRLASSERFAARMIDHLASVLNRQTLYSTIQRVSLTDTLTQLPNRRLFDYILTREFEKVKRDTRSLALLMIDIDYFKDANDRFGHQAGDAILEQVGVLLKNCFRSIDLPARYGGEEFAVILPDTDMKSALAAAERLREEVQAAAFMIGVRQVAISVSIGIAVHNSRKQHCYCDHAAFLHAADLALYQAKEQGRNRVVAAKIG